MRKSYRQLKAEERVQIATLRYQSFTLPEISRVARGPAQPRTV